MCWSFLVEVWLWFSVLATAAGWILSALGQLNRAGYMVFFGITAALVWWGRKAVWRSVPDRRLRWQRLRRRFRRPLPFGFAVLALLVFLGGALYPPSAHTAMTYHIPRVLHWLAEGRWHWIHTPVSRMNHSFCGMEWMIAPLLLFLKTDRVMFLLNFIPFLLLPGLIFSVCVGLGVRPRVAWCWMWLLPTGYNFLLQGGGAGNDTFSAIYALAAIHFGLRAWSFRHTRDLWNSILAAALLTGAKASNLPLLLPWAILIVALLPRLRRRLGASLLVVLLAATVSFLPCAVLNKLYCGDWLGTTIEVPHLEMHRPLIGILGNVFQLLTNNFVPPFFVLAGWWNQHAPLIFPQAWVAVVTSNFDTGYFWLGELPTEDWAGVGFGVSVLVAASVLAGLRPGGKRVNGCVKPESSVPAAALRDAGGLGGVAGLLHQVRSGHGRPADIAVLSVVAAVVDRRGGTGRNHSPPVVEGIGRWGHGSGHGRVGVCSGAAVVAGANDFVKSRRRASATTIARSRAKSLFRLCRQILIRWLMSEPCCPATSKWWVSSERRMTLTSRYGGRLANGGWNIFS